LAHPTLSTRETTRNECFPGLENAQLPRQDRSHVHRFTDHDGAWKKHLKTVSSYLSQPVVYVIDDDDAVRDSLDLFLTLKGLDVIPFNSAKAVLETKARNANLVILDVNMPDVDGFGLLDELRKRGAMAPVILITGLGDLEVRSRAERAGVAAFFDKPIDTPALFDRVREILFEANR
jgi:FixJ family two-component response regulator